MNYPTPTSFVDRRTELIHKLLYTKTAAASITGKKLSDILHVLPEYTGVRVNGQIVSRRKFYLYFAQSRKERSVEYLVSPSPSNSNCFVVRRHAVGNAHALSDNRIYHVMLQPEQHRIYCNCEDYDNQISMGFKTQCCKHCYAVLGKLGYGSLAQYIKATSTTLQQA